MNAQTDNAEENDGTNLYSRRGLFTYFENGFELAVGTSTTRVAWVEIQALFGYKRDLYAYDLVCLDIFLTTGLSFSLHEQVLGWHYFARRLSEQFPDIKCGWEIDLSYPPFETNFTLLYERAGLNQEEATHTYYRPEPTLKKKIAAWLRQLFQKTTQ